MLDRTLLTAALCSRPEALDMRAEWIAGQPGLAWGGHTGFNESGEDHVESGGESPVAVAGEYCDEVVSLGGSMVASVGYLLGQRVPLVSSVELRKGLFIDHEAGCVGTQQAARWPGLYSGAVTVRSSAISVSERVSVAASGASGSGAPDTSQPTMQYMNTE